MVPNIISLFLIIIFVQYLYSRRAHKTREHVFHCCCGMCASIIHHRGTLRTETPHRQQGHVAHNRHWTVDLSQSPSSWPAPRRHLFLPPSAVTQNIIFINFSYAQLRTLSAFLSLLGHVPRCLRFPSVPQPFSSHRPLSSSFLFALLLLWVSVLR